MRTDTTNIETAEIAIIVTADMPHSIDILNRYIDNTIHIDDDGVIRSERHEHIPQIVTDDDYFVMYTISSPVRTLTDFMVIPHEIHLDELPEWITEKYRDIGVTITGVY